MIDFSRISFKWHGIKRGRQLNVGQLLTHHPIISSDPLQSVLVRKVVEPHYVTTPPDMPKVLMPKMTSDHQVPVHTVESREYHPLGWLGAVTFGLYRGPTVKRFLNYVDVTSVDRIGVCEALLCDGYDKRALRRYLRERGLRDGTLRTTYHMLPVPAKG